MSHLSFVPLGSTRQGKIMSLMLWAGANMGVPGPLHMPFFGLKNVSFSPIPQLGHPLLQEALLICTPHSLGCFDTFPTPGRGRILVPMAASMLKEEAFNRHAC